MGQYQDELRRIASELGLRFDMNMQDWGRECSDPARIAEFVRVYFDSAHSDPWVDHEFAELICSSVDYAMQDGVLRMADLNLVAEWVAVVWNRPGARWCLRIWAKLGETPNPSDPYPFGEWLRCNYERITKDSLEVLSTYSITDV